MRWFGRSWSIMFSRSPAMMSWPARYRPCGSRASRTSTDPATRRVLPVILRGSRALLGARQWLRRPTLTVTVGAPFCLWTRPGLTPDARRAQLDALAKLEAEQQAATLDPEIEARMAQAEMAWRMQTSVPEATDTSGEPEEVFNASSTTQGRIIRWTYTSLRLEVVFEDVANVSRFRLTSESLSAYERVLARVRRGTS